MKSRTYFGQVLSETRKVVKAIQSKQHRAIVADVLDDLILIWNKNWQSDDEKNREMSKAYQKSAKMGSNLDPSIMKPIIKSVKMVKSKAKSLEENK